MKIKYAVLNWYGRILAGLAIPLVVLDFSEPAWWTSRESEIAFGVLFVLVGIPTGLIFFLQRMGKIEIVYLEKDKQKMTYKLSKVMAERENQNRPFGKLYSEKYFKTYHDAQPDEPSDKESKNQK
jgi:hypothetical protein